MKRKLRRLIPVALAVSVVAGAWVAWRRERPEVDDAAAVARPPRIRPDYSGSVIPPNVAPLNFAVREPGTRIPKIPGSALHGAIRSYAAQLFETPEAAGQSQDEVDDPDTIIKGVVEERRKLLIGFLGNPKADRRKVLDALKPDHYAISLSGEPTLYPYIGDLIGLADPAKRSAPDNLIHHLLVVGKCF